MNTKTIIICVLFLFPILSLLNAQITIDGTITDFEFNPISNALVEIIDQEDTLNRYSAYSNESGYFLIANITDIIAGGNKMPSDFVLLRNYPNPFNPSTIIYYELPKSANIEIKIFDILGREVRTLFDNFQKAGTHYLNWNGRNNWNSPVSSGIYFCYLKGNNISAVHKMVLLDGGSAAPPANMNQTSALQKNDYQLAKEVFNYSIRISGENILYSEFTNLACINDTSLSLQVSKIMQRKTIGSEGGTIETEGFKLVVPGGSFSEPADLELGIDPGVNDEVDDRLSQTYRIDGLPENFSKPVKFYIQYQNEGITDSISISIGKIKEDLITGEEFVSFDEYNAVDSSGYAVVELMDTNVNFLKTSKINKTRSLSFATVLLSGGKIKSSDGNFRFKFPKSLAAFIPDLDQYAADALLKYITIGFIKKTVGTNNLPYWPIDIKIRKMKQDAVLLLDYKNYKPVIQINRKYLNNQDILKLKYNIGQAVYFCFVLQDYSKEEMSSDEHYWLHHAVYSFMENIFVDDPSHIPVAFKLLDQHNLNYKGILYGLNYNSTIKSKEGASRHGMSAVPFLYYLAKNPKYSTPILSKIYYNLERSIPALQAILKSLEEPEYKWWEGFIREYIEGRIYNLSTNVFSEDLLDAYKYNIESHETAEKVFEEDYENLSANLYRININSSNFKDDDRLRFSVYGDGTNYRYVNLYVWGIKENQLDYIISGYDIILNSSINELIQNGYSNLLLCVTNSFSESPFTNKTRIDLRIRLFEEERFFKKCVLRFTIAGEYLSDTGPVDLNALAHWEFNEGVHIDGDFFTSSWDSSSVYTNEYDKEILWDQYKYISGNIDLATMTVSNIYAEIYSLESIQDFNRNETATSIRLIDYPLEKTLSGEGWFSCEVEGTEIDLSKVIVNDRVDSELYYTGETSWLQFNLSKESPDNEISIMFME